MGAEITEDLKNLLLESGTMLLIENYVCSMVKRYLQRCILKNKRDKV